MSGIRGGRGMRLIPRPAPRFPGKLPKANMQLEEFECLVVDPRGNKKQYHVTPYPPVMLRSYRVENASAEYDVCETESGRAKCTCPDFERRHKDLPYSGGCKHIAALAIADKLTNRFPEAAARET